MRREGADVVDAICAEARGDSRDLRDADRRLIEHTVDTRRPIGVWRDLGHEQKGVAHGVHRTRKPAARWLRSAAPTGLHSMNDRFASSCSSFLMLFVELALIRWTGSNVLYLSYFSNFVLLGSFLGIGIGFLRARKPTTCSRARRIALGALIAFIRFFPVDVTRGGSELIFFGGLQTARSARANSCCR